MKEYSTKTVHTFLRMLPVEVLRVTVVEDGNGSGGDGGGGGVDNMMKKERQDKEDDDDDEEEEEEDDDDEYLVDCCRLAHYLQCEELLERIVQILIESINSDNCLSLLSLADQLNLPNLFESSLNHILKNLPTPPSGEGRGGKGGDTPTSTTNTDNYEDGSVLLYWEELHPEIREQIELIR